MVQRSLSATVMVAIYLHPVTTPACSFPHFLNHGRGFSGDTHPSHYYGSDLINLLVVQ